MDTYTIQNHPYDPRQERMTGGCFRCGKGATEHETADLRKSGSRLDVYWLGEFIGQVQGKGTRWIWYRPDAIRWNGFSVTTRREAIEHLIGL